MLYCGSVTGGLSQQIKMYLASISNLTADMSLINNSEANIADN
jgi:hypothetical protein